MADVRVTQLVAEIIGPGQPAVRATQLVAEIIGPGQPAVRATQLVVEVIGLDLSFAPDADPTGLSCERSGPTVDLTWTDNATDETGYEVWRATSSAGPFTVVAALGADVDEYEDTGLSPTVTYWYFVRAVKGVVRSGPSNTVMCSSGTGNRMGGNGSIRRRGGGANPGRGRGSGNNPGRGQGPPSTPPGGGGGPGGGGSPSPPTGTGPPADRPTTPEDDAGGRIIDDEDDPTVRSRLDEG